MAAATSDQFAAFRHSSYSRYFVARFLSSTGVQVVGSTIGFHLYELTGSEWLLGLIGLVQFLPAIILVIPAGLASDRVGRRFVMGLSIVLEMLCALAIVGLAVLTDFNPTVVLGTLFVFGIARAFYAPAATSLAVNLVPTEDFANAVGWNTAAWQLSHIIGPALGGVLYIVSPSTAYTVAALMLAGAALLIFSIPRPPQRIDREPTTFRTLTAGFAYIWRQKVVLGAISLDLFAVLLGGAVAMLPVYSADILEIGAVGNGVLRASPAVGAVVMLLWLTRFPVRDHAGVILFVSVGLFGLATAVFGVSTLPWLSVLALVLVGALDMVSVYIRQIILQLWTPDSVRGRVNAVNGIFLGASNELGEFRAGAMAAYYGAVFTVTAGGFAAMGVSALFAALFPGLRRIRYLDAAPEEVAQDDVR